MKRWFSTFLLIVVIIFYIAIATATSEAAYPFPFTLQNDSPVEITELRVSVLTGEREGWIRPLVDPLSSGSSLDTYYSVGGDGGFLFSREPQSVIVNVEIIDSNGDSWIFGEFDIVETDTFIFTVDASGEAHLMQILR